MRMKKLFNTAYLSLTRGDGGQNLIGPEIRENLGLIRTQELLAARRIDGGTQFFSRANDFGYSKNPNETLSIWDKEKVLKILFELSELLNLMLSSLGSILYQVLRMAIIQLQPCWHWKRLISRVIPVFTLTN